MLSIPEALRSAFPPLLLKSEVLTLRLSRLDKDKKQFESYGALIKELFEVLSESKEINVLAEFTNPPFLYSSGCLRVQPDYQDLWDVSKVDKVKLEVWIQFVVPK
jgi:hypothetical protein